MATETRLTLADYIKSAGITMNYSGTDHNALMEDSERMDHWRVTLKAGRSHMTITYSKGSGHNGTPPEIAEVISCLVSDAQGIENSKDFADWCSDYGYSENSRKAERIYKACARERDRLKALLGESAYDILLWHVERS